MESRPGKESAPGLSYERATASPEDVATFIELEKSVDGARTYSAMTTEEEARAEIARCTVYFVKRGEQVVGSVAYEMKSPDHAYISGLVTKPEFQGQDIGREVMTKVLSELANVPLIDLVTHPENARSTALYESLGFKKGEVKENYFDDGEPRVVMTLRR